MNTIVGFLSGKKAVSPVIGTILMVAVTVIMAAIIGGFVYQTGRPKVSPNLATTLQDDDRVILVSDNGTGRIAKLTVEGGKNIAASELKAIVTYIGGDENEYTAILDGSEWGDGTEAAPGIEMGTDRIGLRWVDSDASTDLTPGDRLDFATMGDVDGLNVSPQTDFEVKITHKSTEATLASHSIKVY